MFKGHVGINLPAQNWPIFFIHFIGVKKQIIACYNQRQGKKNCEIWLTTEGSFHANAHKGILIEAIGCCSCKADDHRLSQIPPLQ
jgi:hypothetical protein